MYFVQIISGHPGNFHIRNRYWEVAQKVLGFGYRSGSTALVLFINVGHPGRPGSICFRKLWLAPYVNDWLEIFSWKHIPQNHVYHNKKTQKQIIILIWLLGPYECMIFFINYSDNIIKKEPIVSQWAIFSRFRSENPQSLNTNANMRKSKTGKKKAVTPS